MSKVQIGDKITSRIGDSCERGTVIRSQTETFTWSLEDPIPGQREGIDRYNTEGIEWVLGWDTIAADALRVAVALGQK